MKYTQTTSIYNISKIHFNFSVQTGGNILFYKSITCALDGINGYTVTVEADISKGIPNFSIVGLPDISVRESRERIKSAITNSRLKYPGRKIVINLSPSDIRKEGSHFDLAIAVCILNSEYEFLQNRHERTAFIGELSLNGEIAAVKGVIPFILNAKGDPSVEKVIVPYDNFEEASVIDDIEIYPVKNLSDVIAYLSGKVELSRLEAADKPRTHHFEFDYSDIKGNGIAKRAAEICAAGKHNLFMIGSAGSGKTMIAKRIVSIMSELTDEEYIEVSKIYSSSGLFNDDIIRRTRPFRSPHHTATIKSIIGGGASSSPGEVVLSHNGVLFLDELLEFDKKALEALRQPIEDKKIAISRIKRTNIYPCDFVLVACCNPCPCGNYNNPHKECRCSEYRIKSYLSKASNPLLDRFDLFVEVHPVDFEDIVSPSEEEKSEDIRARVIQAQAIQRKRYRKSNNMYNDGLKSRDIEKYCILTEDASQFINMVFNKNKLSIRSYHKLLKVSRTIADLDGSDIIDISHISEAVSFRKPLDKYWG